MRRSRIFRRWVIWLALCTAAGALLLPGLRAARAARIAGIHAPSTQFGIPPGSNCANRSSWSFAASPDGGVGANYFESAAATSPTDVWAVGSYTTPYAQPLIEHLDGSQWTVVAGASAAGSQTDQLTGVAADSLTDAWAVGQYSPGAGGSGTSTLIEHWDGTTWSVVPSPDGAVGENFLNGVAAISPTNVWAVGSYYTSTQPNRTLIEHWDGTAWTIIAGADYPFGNDNWLSAVAAVSASDVWTVGHLSNSGTLPQTLIEHWNGSYWSVVTSPNASGTGGNELNGIAAVSSTNVWAVGDAHSTDGSSAQTLVEQWNGTSWSIVPSPSISGMNFSLLYGVATLPSGVAWAVGLSSTANPNNNYLAGQQTLIERWNGASWSIAPSPNAPVGESQLTSVTAISSHDIWAVGYSNTQNYASDTLTEHQAGMLLC